MTSIKKFLDIQIGIDDQTAEDLERICEFFEVSLDQIVIDALGAHINRLEWEKFRFDERAEEAEAKASENVNQQTKSEFH